MPVIRAVLGAMMFIPLYIAACLAWLHYFRRPPPSHWSTASRASSGLAPDPSTTSEAVVQIYAARAWGWRGYFGAHVWIAVKPTNARRYTVYEVIGWRLRQADSAVVISSRVPDGAWFGNLPELLGEARGAGVDDMIARLHQAVHAYPYAHTYRLWPGPNSNTFVAFVLRAVPALRVALPALAVGKDYLGRWPFARLPSRTGWQFNLFGLFGVAVGWKEGIEVNLLGLSFGLRPLGALELPLLGSRALIPRARGPIYS